MKTTIDLTNIDLTKIDNALNEIEYETNSYFEKVKSNPATSFGEILKKEDNVKMCNYSILNNI